MVLRNVCFRSLLMFLSASEKLVVRKIGSIFLLEGRRTISVDIYIVECGTSIPIQVILKIYM